MNRKQVMSILGVLPQFETDAVKDLRNEMRTVMGGLG